MKWKPRIRTHSLVDWDETNSFILKEENWMKKNTNVAKSSLKSLRININQDRIFQFDFPPSFKSYVRAFFCGNNAGVFCVSKTPAYSSSFLTYLHTLAQIHCLPMMIFASYSFNALWVRHNWAQSLHKMITYSLELETFIVPSFPRLHAKMAAIWEIFVRKVIACALHNCLVSFVMPVCHQISARKHFSSWSATCPALSNFYTTSLPQKGPTFQEIYLSKLKCFSNYPILRFPASYFQFW